MPVGKRVQGHDMRMRRWYECHVSGLEADEDETVVPEYPHPQAGTRVLVDEWLDEPDDRETLRIINGPPDIGHDNEEFD